MAALSFLCPPALSRGRATARRRGLRRSDRSAPAVDRTRESAARSGRRSPVRRGPPTPRPSRAAPRRRPACAATPARSRRSRACRSSRHSSPSSAPRAKPRGPGPGGSGRSPTAAASSPALTRRSESGVTSCSTRTLSVIRAHGFELELANRACQRRLRDMQTLRDEPLVAALPQSHRYASDRRLAAHARARRPESATRPSRSCCRGSYRASWVQEDRFAPTRVGLPTWRSRSDRKHQTAHVRHHLPGPRRGRFTAPGSAPSGSTRRRTRLASELVQARAVGRREGFVSDRPAPNAPARAATTQPESARPDGSCVRSAAVGPTGRGRSEAGLWPVQLGRG